MQRRADERLRSTGELASDPMSAHPSIQHEIAQLRHEERLVRAALVHAHPNPADDVRTRVTGGIEKLFVTVRAHLGARPGFAAIRGPQLLSRLPSTTRTTSRLEGPEGPSSLPGARRQ